MSGGRHPAREGLGDGVPCEGATCPCGHEALDHKWSGCEECACKRSGIHAALSSGVVTLAADREPGLREAAIKAEALREAAEEWTEWEVFIAGDGERAIRMHGRSFPDWLRDRAAALTPSTRRAGDGECR
jgi:hypothetical protein